MRDQDLDGRPDGDDAPASGLQGTRERRQWVRYELPDLVTRVSWASDGKTVMQMAGLLNVSAGGAAILVDGWPPADQPLAVYFDHQGVTRGPIPADVVRKRPHHTGRTLLQLRFRATEAPGGAFGARRERRAWRRMTPREKRVVLAWREDGREYSAPGELVNLSGGGAAVLTEGGLPEGGPIWLSVGPEGDAVGAVECRLVGAHHDLWERRVLRLAFADLCPIRIYEAAMGLSALVPER